MAADGDISRFVVAGATFVEAGSEADDRLHVFPSNGYDGQFYWRLAVEPSEWQLGSERGVAFDSAYRAPRIGYPLLAHLAAGGRPGLVAWSLVGLNVAAVGAVAYAGARIAAHGGRSPVWGLTLAAAPGLVMALGRDLAECVTVAGVVGGIAALQADRPRVAAAAWTLAVLTREQALLTVGAYAAWRLVALIRSRRSATAAPARRRDPTAALAPSQAPAPPPAPPPTRPHSPSTAPVPSEAPAPAPDGPPARPGRHDLPWIAPVVAFVAWQAVLWRDTGRLPLAAAGGTNLVPPFTDMVPGLVGWAGGDLDRLHAVAPLQLALTVALVVAAARAAPTVPGSQRFTVVALALATVAATCLAGSIWRDPSDLRHLVDVSVLSWVVLLVARPRPPGWAAGATAGAWVATAAVRVVAI